MRSVQRLRKVGIVPLYQPQHNFILNYIRKQGARTKMGFFNAKGKYNVESRLQQMGWAVPDFDLQTMKGFVSLRIHWVDFIFRGYEIRIFHASRDAKNLKSPNKKGTEEHVLFWREGRVFGAGIRRVERDI